ncbi:hypothetical protein LY76DRAFT_610344 [Colletotrichum caudatum]|nr:hypothetical protein LY76DRAFT_610344 [Colletotrichum caudatum]
MPLNPPSQIWATAGPVSYLPLDDRPRPAHGQGSHQGGKSAATHIIYLNGNRPALYAVNVSVKSNDTIHPPPHRAFKILRKSVYHKGHAAIINQRHRCLLPLTCTGKALSRSPGTPFQQATNTEINGPTGGGVFQFVSFNKTIYMGIRTLKLRGAEGFSTTADRVIVIVGPRLETPFTGAGHAARDHHTKARPSSATYLPPTSAETTPPARKQQVLRCPGPESNAEGGDFVIGAPALASRSSGEQQRLDNGSICPF